MNVKFKFVTPDFTKAQKDAERIIEGYASTFDVDRQYEVVTPEAMQKAVGDLLTTNTTVFYEHKHEQLPVGRILDARVDDEGLWIKVLISQTANEVWTLIQEGILNKFSIGGKVTGAFKKFDKSLNRDITFITDMVLYEVSVVGLPANQNASFKAKSLASVMIKALEGREKIDEALKIIQGGVKTMDEKIEKKEEPKAEETKLEKKEEPKVEAAKEEVVEKKVEDPKPEEVIAKSEVPETPPAVDPKVEKPVEPEMKKELSKEEIEALVEKTSDKKEEVVPVKEKAMDAPAGDPNADESAYVYEQDATVVLEALTAKVDEILAIVKDIQSKAVTPTAPAAPVVKAEEVVTPTTEVPVVKAEEAPVAKVEEPIQKALTAEDVAAIVSKTFDEKVGKIRLVPSRKGTLIKSDLELKSETNSDDLDILMDEKKFDKLPKEEQTKLIRKSLFGIITGK